MAIDRAKLLQELLSTSGEYFSDKPIFVNSAIDNAMNEYGRLAVIEKAVAIVTLAGQFVYDLPADMKTVIDVYVDRQLYAALYTSGFIDTGGQWFYYYSGLPKQYYIDIIMDKMEYYRALEVQPNIQNWVIDETAKTITFTYVPNAFSPLNGSTDISTRPSLCWSSTSNTDYYEVYITTTPPDPYGELPIESLIGTSTSISLTMSPAMLETHFGYTNGKLANSTTYYWRVVARNSSGGTSTLMPVWSFTTGASEQLMVDQSYGSLSSDTYIVHYYVSPDATTIPDYHYEYVYKLASSILMTKQALAMSKTIQVTGPNMTSTFVNPQVLLQLAKDLKAEVFNSLTSYVPERG